MLDGRKVVTGRAGRVNAEESRTRGLCGFEGQVKVTPIDSGS